MRDNFIADGISFVKEVEKLRTVINKCIIEGAVFRLVRYGEKHGLKLDYRRKWESILKITYTGSFAYMTKVCSDSGLCL